MALPDRFGPGWRPVARSLEETVGGALARFAITNMRLSRPDGIRERRMKFRLGSGRGWAGVDECDGNLSFRALRRLRPFVSTVYC